MSFKENINRICLERGTNLTAVVKQVKGSSSFTSSINKGSLPKEDEMVQMAKILNCSVIDFFMDEEDLAPQNESQNEDEADNVLNSGIDVQFCVMKACKNKEAAYEVLRFLYEDDTIRTYLDEQGGIACKQGDFQLSSELEGVRPYIESDRMADFQDHHYPSEMSVDAMIQTYLLDDSADAKKTFLNKFDKDWKRYNRDLIWKVQQYNEKEGTSEDTK